MEIQHREEGGKGIFFVDGDGSILAELVYTIPSSDKIIIEHTEVDDSLSGKGVGNQLVVAARDYAREKNLKIIPLCSFAKSIFKKHRDWQDVLVYPV